MCLSNFSGPELISLANALAVIVSNDLSSENLAVLAAFFTSFADNLALLALQQN